MNLVASVLLVAAVTASGVADVPDAAAVARGYAELGHRSYTAALEDAVAMDRAIAALLEDPTDATLGAAKRAWLVARDSYGQTEVFRFYDGPIDFADETTGVSGPELQLNAWPLNEAYIDAVVSDRSIRIDRRNLISRNGADDEADVTTGYHAVEYLLWGRDVDADGPGRRPVSDLMPGDEIRERRRLYLGVVSGLIVSDLETLVRAWEPGTDNYAARFVALPPEDALTKIFRGMIQLAGFELAMERLAVPLDSGDQEDEHSCFSDNTHNDFVANVRGLRNVWSGRYGEWDAIGPADLLGETNPDLRDRIETRLARLESMAEELPRPFDRLLAPPPEDPGRARAEAMIVELRELAEYWSLARARLTYPAVEGRP